MNIEDFTGEDRKFYTREIKLKLFSRQDFQLAQRFWSKNASIRRENVYSRVFNPLEVTPEEGDALTEKDYYRLLRFLVGHKYADELYVHDGTRRHKAYVRTLRRTMILDFAEAAFRDSKKKNFLEIHLKKDPMDYDHATIGFTEYGGRLVGYELFCPESLSDLFDVDECRRDYKNNYGIWVPDAFLKKNVLWEKN